MKCEPRLRLSAQLDSIIAIRVNSSHERWSSPWLSRASSSSGIASHG
jgi:hypothetical protein